MLLRPGTRLGAYEILALLGAGGMGEVYCAHDTRLQREVALKVLPAESLRDETARARLLREARLAATLNHPNICTVHEVGEIDGHVYIAMELVEGEPLSEKIAERPDGLATENVARYGAQIASALAHAHERHVIHRDLKSSNVMVIQDGRVKVLDFGVARRVWEGPDDSARTLQLTLTETGAIIGTPHYLAPEVLHGGVADERSDLWALGVLLHEMASGVLPFKGTTSFELAAAIMNDLPLALPGRLPAGLQGCVRRCLVKEPGERYQRASEARAALETLQSESAGPVASAVTTREAAQDGVAAIPTSSLRGARRWVLGIAATGVVMAIAAVLVLLPKGPPRLDPDMRTRTVDVPMSGIRYPGLSQDGRWIALPARDDRGVYGLYYMNASVGEVRPIAVDTSVSVFYADISPDGGQVVYGVGSSHTVSEIRLVPALGGAFRTLASLGDSPRWSPDGKRIGYMVAWDSPSHKLEFWTVRPDGSDRSQVFVDSTSEVGVSWSFAWAPDGKRIAWLRNFAHSTYNEIFIHDLATGRERQLTHDRKIVDEVAWTPQGEILFSSNRGGASNLWIMGASGGRPVQVTRGAGPDIGMRVSADGRTLLYLVQEEVESIGWWDVVTGERGRTTHEAQPFDIPVVPSPDGRRIAVRVHDPDALTTEQALVVMNRDGSGRRRLVAAEGAPRTCDWSPDGRRIAWASIRSSRGDSMDLHIVDVATGETSTPLIMATRGRVRWICWPSADTLLVHDDRGSFLYSLSEKSAFDRSPDQTFLYPVRVPGWKLFLDRRQGMANTRVFVRPEQGGAERPMMPEAWMPGNPPHRDFLYCWPASLPFSRLELPSGRLTRVAHVPPEVRRGMYCYPTRDGRVVFWVERHEASKLVLVENLHK